MPCDLARIFISSFLPLGKVRHILSQFSAIHLFLYFVDPAIPYRTTSKMVIGETNKKFTHIDKNKSVGIYSHISVSHVCATNRRMISDTNAGCFLTPGTKTHMRIKKGAALTESKCRLYKIICLYPVHMGNKGNDRGRGKGRGMDRVPVCGHDPARSDPGSRRSSSKI